MHQLCLLNDERDQELDDDLGALTNNQNIYTIHPCNKFQLKLK